MNHYLLQYMIQMIMQKINKPAQSLCISKGILYFTERIIN